MSWRISLVLATAAIPLGCHEPASAPPFFEPALPDRELWSGGEIRVTVPAFANTTAIVLLGSDTLTYRLADETRPPWWLVCHEGPARFRCASWLESSPPR